MNSSSPIDILVLGRTGTGKSDLGNSILRKKTFKTSCDVLSETINAQFDYTFSGGRTIKVVDTPGLGDNRLDPAADLQQFLVAINVAIASNPSGYHAILYVIPFGNRYEDKDVEAVIKLKQIFGTEFIRDHCILVLTHGDKFESDPEIKKENVTFEDWVRRQEEPNFKELVAECGSRVLLFNNRAKRKERKREQIAKLLQTIDQLNGRRFTNSEFQAAESERDRLYTSLQMPYLKEENLKEIGLIIFFLKKSQLDRQELEELSQRANNLLSKIIKDDKNSGQLNKFIDIVSRIRQNIVEQLLQMDDTEINHEKQSKPEIKFKRKQRDEEKLNLVQKRIQKFEAKRMEDTKKTSRVEDKNEERKLTGNPRYCTGMKTIQKNLETRLRKAAKFENEHQLSKSEECKRQGIWSNLLNFISKILKSLCFRRINFFKQEREC